MLQLFWVNIVLFELIYFSLSTLLVLSAAFLFARLRIRGCRVGDAGGNSGRTRGFLALTQQICQPRYTMRLHAPTRCYEASPGQGHPRTQFLLGNGNAPKFHHRLGKVIFRWVSNSTMKVTILVLRAIHFLPVRVIEGCRV